MNQTGTSSIEVEMLRLTLFISVDAQSVALMHVGGIDMIFFFFFFFKVYVCVKQLLLFISGQSRRRARAVSWMVGRLNLVT